MTDTHKTTDEGTNRREFLKVASTGAALTTTLAGCIGTEDGGGGTTTDGGGGGTTTGTTTDTGPSQVTVGQPGSLTGKWDFLQPRCPSRPTSRSRR